MESYGKIFVVVAVLSVILVGIFIYLFFMDRKIGKLEKEVEDKIANTRK
ncbi:MAG: CcmD family protein [Bacteroidales bacterium]|jgi:CcmD family protein|nr:CcmD family protein [Bacteroidales bacterium]